MQNIYLPLNVKVKEVTALYHKELELMFVSLETPESIPTHESTPDIFRALDDRIEVMTFDVKTG